MKTKIILDIKWLQEENKARPGKMIQTADFFYIEWQVGVPLVTAVTKVPLRKLNRVNKEHDPPLTLGLI